MAYIPQFIKGNFWGGQRATLEGVRYIAGIKNSGTVGYTIDNVYVQNHISNPQELDNITNFAFTIPDELVSYQLLDQSSIVGKGDDEKYKIPYPSNYLLQPGNVAYAPYGQTNNVYNWRFRNTFSLNQNQILYFVIQFTPEARKQDFYKADLVLKFHQTGSSSYETQKFSLSGDFLYEIDEIDTKNFPSQVMSVSGVPFGGLITIH